MTTLPKQKGSNGSRRLTTESHSVGRPPTTLLKTGSRTEEITVEDLQLILLLAQGLPAQKIARILCTSGRTLRRRIRALCHKIGVRTPIEAAVWAARRGLI